MDKSNTVIPEIKQRIKMKGLNSIYYLAFCDLDWDKRLEVTDILELREGERNIEFGDSKVLLSDSKGKILRAFTKRFDEDMNIVKYTVDKVSGNKIIITEQHICTKSRNEECKRSITIEYELTDEFKEVKRFETNNHNAIKKVKFVGHQNDIVLLESQNKDGPQAYLFSLKTQSLTSPIFKKLEPTDKENIFLFTDEIKSKKTINEIPETTEIYGCINTDGIFGNQIYDDNAKEIRQVNLNEGPKFVQYYRLKEAISKELDKRVDQKISEIENKHDQIQKILKNV